MRDEGGEVTQVSGDRVRVREGGMREGGISTADMYAWCSSFLSGNPKLG